MATVRVVISRAVGGGWDVGGAVGACARCRSISGKNAP